MFYKKNFPTNNSRNLDFLRTFAILLVVLSHIPITELPINKYYHTQTMGLLGVYIFFVHTSCVLMFSLERMGRIKGSQLIYKFYTQRLFRVYPLSIFAVLLFSFYKIINIDNFNLDLITLFKNIFLIQDINESMPPALWSLPYEVAMYFFFPLIFIFIIKRNYEKKIISLWFFFSVLVVIQKYFETSYYSTIVYVPFFLSGVIAFVYSKKIENEKKIRSVYLVLYVFFSILLIPVLINFIFRQSLIGAIFCLPLGLLIAYCKDMQISFFSIFFKLIARYSYGIYLFHQLIILIYYEYFYIENAAFSLVLLLILIFSISATGYHVIEKPLIKFGKKISKRY